MLDKQSPEYKRQLAEWMLSFNTPHPDGEWGSFIEYEKKRQAIYEAWLDSVNQKPVAGFSSRVKFLFLAPYRWFLQLFHSG